jgi:hypothetical protein
MFRARPALTPKQVSTKILSRHAIVVPENSFCYQLVSRGMIAKAEGEYKRATVRLLTLMRLAGEIPFGWTANPSGRQETYGGSTSKKEARHKVIAA